MKEETRLTEMTASLDRLAQILRDNEVDVRQIIKEDTQFTWLPHITFFGDDNEGMRVAQIALAHGYPVVKFEHHWHYDKSDENSINGFVHKWSISIKRFAPEAVPGEYSPC